MNKRRVPVGRAEEGFTLIELMVVLTIVAVLTAMAAPAMRETVARYQTSTVAEQVASILSTARVEAIRRSGNVVLEKINGTTNPCTDDQQWSCGARLWADLNRNGARNGTDPTLPTTDPILREFDVPAGVSLLNMSGGAASLTFNRWGQANGINALRFQVSRTGVADADRSVCVATGGRIRVVQGIVCPP